jgi:pimeloyl-ACP methyl ester carboxylesterase
MPKQDIKMETLRINRLKGRFFRARSDKSREILIVYDIPMNLEQIIPLANAMTEYGNVTAMDLPGFGGMSSFYAIKKKPTLANYAGYLAAFIKLRFKRRRLTIVGIGIGFSIITQCLKQYPSIAKRVDTLVSIDGLLDKTDLRLNPSERFTLNAKRRLQSTRLAAFVAKHTSFQPSIIENTLKNRDVQLSKEQIAVVAAAWKEVHIRSYRQLQRQLLRLELAQQTLTIPLHHLQIPYTYYDIDHELSAEHMQILSKITWIHANDSNKKLLEILQDEKSIKRALPNELKKVLK